MKKLIACLSLLLAMPAQAEFTPAEDLEMQKLIQSGLDIQDALIDLTDGCQVSSNPACVISTLAPSNKPAMAQVIAWINAASFNVKTTMDAATGAETLGMPTRAQQIQQLKSRVVNIAPKAQNAADILLTLPADPEIDQAISKLSNLPVATFDTTLPYLDPVPSGVQSLTGGDVTVIGPHGKWQEAQKRLEHMVQYQHHMLEDYNNTWATTSGSFLEFAKGMRSMSELIGTSFRVWGLSAAVVLPDDAATISADAAATNNIRPPDFMRLLLEIEYSAAPSGKNHRGRNFKPAIAFDFRGASDSYRRYIRNLTNIEKTELWRNDVAITFSPSSVSASPAGWADEFYSDQPDSWDKLDIYLGSVMLFFEGSIIPLPPSGGGTQCGVGTHEQDGFCVPDDPQACPVFVPSLVLLDGVTAQAQCLQQ